MSDEVLADQVDYYHRRAGEYDVTAYGDVGGSCAHRATGRADAADRTRVGDRVRDWLVDRGAGGAGRHGDGDRCGARDGGDRWRSGAVGEGQLRCCRRVLVGPGRPVRRDLLLGVAVACADESGRTVLAVAAGPAGREWASVVHRRARRPARRPGTAAPRSRSSPVRRRHRGARPGHSSGSTVWTQIQGLGPTGTGLARVPGLPATYPGLASAQTRHASAVLTAGLPRSAGYAGFESHSFLSHVYAPSCAVPQQALS